MTSFFEFSKKQLKRNHVFPIKTGVSFEFLVHFCMKKLILLGFLNFSFKIARAGYMKSDFRIFYIEIVLRDFKHRMCTS